MTAGSKLRQIVEENRAGQRRGIPSYCVANADVLAAVLHEYRDDDAPLLIEATCNQVNQFGGYTGMKPQDFAGRTRTWADEVGVCQDRILLGGDHLGPNPWRDQTACDAMAKAETLVRAYAESGFLKIHLDASMACAGEKLSDEEIALRAARLCAAAEDAGVAGETLYIIGSEVPAPGGETGHAGGLRVTSPASLAKTITTHRRAFERLGLKDVLNRVLGVVVQPGVDFSNGDVVGFSKTVAADLSSAIEGYQGMTFEAHSTDYQSQEALNDLVDGHFAVLKVGPELTFAYRESVIAAAHMEAFCEPGEGSGILNALAEEMDRDPAHWRDYVHPSETAAQARLFGLSDRVRYYWASARVRSALDVLKRNINAASVSRGLLSQFVGEQDLADLPARPTLFDAIVQHKVGRVVRKYRRACGEIEQKKDYGRMI